jgi:hypothetical protein
MKTRLFCSLVLLLLLAFGPLVCFSSVEAQSVSFAPPTNFSVGSGPEDIATGDFSEDGNLDLVVTNGSDNTISVLLGDGAG